MATLFSAAFGRLFPFARRAVREGIGVTASRNALRQGGLSFSNAAYSEAHAVANRLETVARLERGANLATRPHATRIVRGPWGFTEKWGQVVRLDLTDVATGAAKRWDITITGDRLMSRGEAIDLALQKVAPDALGYGVEIVDASYSHTLGRA